MPETSEFTSYFVSNKRPYFGPKQVRTLKGIKPGRMLLGKMHGKPFHFIFIVRGKPFQDDNGNWFVPVSRKSVTEKGRWYSLEISLSDYGVIPYKNGQWHTKNWLSRI